MGSPVNVSGPRAWRKGGKKLRTLVGFMMAFIKTID